MKMLTSQVLEASRGYPELLLVETKLEAELNKNRGPVQEISRYLLSAGGKRIRPLLACISGRLFKAKLDEIITCAAAIELIHMASLIHDDIVDNSDMRRGLPSVNACWGNHAAVLVGDFLFAKAFQLLSFSRLLPVLEKVVEAISAMCDGEIEQSLQRGKISRSEQDYLERINKKTGKLIAASCSVGALLERGDPVKRLSLENYGQCLGYAFQIVDDVLDFRGDSQAMGKPVWLDLSQGNITLPIIKLLNHPKYSARVEEVLAEWPLTPAGTQEIIQALNESGALDASLEQARSFIDRAKEQLTVFGSSAPVTELSLIADYVLARIN